MSSFLCLTLVVPASAEEDLVAELWARGTLGVEIVPRRSDRILARAYFDRQCRERVDTAVFWPWTELEATFVSAETLLARDWLSRYRRGARPFDIGTRLTVDPREPSGVANEPTGDRFLLRIPARQAFGTGSHESTRLVVEWLEESPPEGQRVLDLGVGTGILSFTALLFGADSVVGLECDPIATLLARQNQDLNRLRFPLVAGRLSCLVGRDLFDLAVVNVLPQAIAPDLSDLVRVLRPGARGIFSGVTADREGESCARLERHGLVVTERKEKESWVALLAERRPR